MNNTIDHRIRGSWTAEGGDAAHLPARALRWLSERIGTGAANRPGPDSALNVPASARRSGNCEKSRWKTSS